MSLVMCLRGAWMKDQMAARLGRLSCGYPRFQGASIPYYDEHIVKLSRMFGEFW